MQNEYYVINRYTSSFDPDFRYGKPLKYLPAGVWFKNNIQIKSPNENKHVITDHINRFLERRYVIIS